MIYRTIDKRLDSNAILQHKTFLMGMSMLSVVFYHAYCVHADIFTSLFKYGFVGVDIFILIKSLETRIAVFNNSYVAILFYISFNLIIAIIFVFINKIIQKHIQ